MYAMEATFLPNIPYVPQGESAAPLDDLLSALDGHTGRAVFGALLARPGSASPGPLTRRFPGARRGIVARVGIYLGRRFAYVIAYRHIYRYSHAFAYES